MTEISFVKPVTHAMAKSEVTNKEIIENLIYFLFGILEILLVFRFVLKLVGASITSNFVSLIYGLSGIFTMPFIGIFRRVFSQGISANSVIEPGTVVAIFVYAILAWGIVKLIRILLGKRN